MVDRIIEKLSVRISQGTARWFISLALLFGIVVPIIGLVGLDGWAGAIIAFIAAVLVTAWTTLCITVAPDPPGYDPNLHYYIVTKPGGELSLSMIGRDPDEVQGIADAIETHLKSQGHEISRELP